MRVFIVLFSLALFNVASPRHKTCPDPILKVNLTEKYQFRPFGLPKHARSALPEPWKTQQGIVFASPGTVAVYQVQKTDQLPPAQPRDISGGGGGFILKIAFLDAGDGKEIRIFDLTTNSGFSHVYATHDGYFLVRTGDVLRLYSPTFEELASKPLPLSRGVKNQAWTVFVFSSSHKIGLKYTADNGYGTPYISTHDVLDADTLETIATLSPNDDRSWPESDSTATRSRFPKALVSMHEDVTPILTDGSLLVGEIWHRRADPFDLLTNDSEPRRIEVYDLTENAERCYISATAKETSTLWPNMFMDLSKDGKIAVIQQEELSIYKP